jgi:hypothetical protein
MAHFDFLGCSQGLSICWALAAARSREEVLAAEANLAAFAATVAKRQYCAASSMADW